MLLHNIKRIFDKRHDFSDPDIVTLKERWPNINFLNIPVAWILPIDQMLCRLRYTNPVYEVRQDFGQFIVLHRGLTSSQQMVVEEAEQDICLIDGDLHDMLECA